MPQRLPLKVYRLNPRKSFVSIDRRDVTMYLPPYLGRKRWTIAIDNIAVADLTDKRFEEPTDDAPIIGGVLVPYFFTTGPMTKPTTALVFREAARIPPVRLVTALASNTDLGVGYFESRSEAGATVDGALLRFADPSGAADALVRAGAEQIFDVDTWLRANRPPATKAEEVSFERRFNRAVWISRLQYAFYALFFALMYFTDDDMPWWQLIVAMAFLVAGVAVRWIATRMIKRDRPDSKRR